MAISGRECGCERARGRGVPFWSFQHLFKSLLRPAEFLLLELQQGVFVGGKLSRLAAASGSGATFIFLCAAKPLCANGLFPFCEDWVVRAARRFTSAPCSLRICTIANWILPRQFRTRAPPPQFSNRSRYSNLPCHGPIVIRSSYSQKLQNSTESEYGDDIVQTYQRTLIRRHGHDLGQIGAWAIKGWRLVVRLGRAERLDELARPCAMRSTSA